MIILFLKTLSFTLERSALISVLLMPGLSLARTKKCLDVPDFRHKTNESDSGEMERSLTNADEQDASLEEIRDAYERLSEAELLRLEGVAKLRIRRIGRAALGRTHDDLLQEALLATLEGRRMWKKQVVTFVKHLIETMRSISSHWAEQLHPAEPVLETELLGTKEHPERPPALGERKSAGKTPIQSAVQAEEEAQAFWKALGDFKDDEAVFCILDDLKKGKALSQIQAELGLSENDFQAALKRLRRGLAETKGKRE